MNAVLRRSSICAALLCALAATGSASAAEDDWEWMVAPYGWAATIGTDLRTGEPPAENDTSFSDIIDKLDGVFQVHVEGQGERFGMFADYTFLGLADDRDFPRLSTRSDLDTQLLEVAATWSPGEGMHRGIELFGGLRFIDVDLRVQFDPDNPQFDTRQIDFDKAYADLMLGARYEWHLSERWDLVVRGDGSFMGTEGTWNASAVAEYSMTRGAWVFGYRHLEVEVEGRFGNSTEITMSGPMVGYGFKF